MTTVSFRHRLEYVAFRAAAAELLKLPAPAAFVVAEGAGALAYRLLRSRTRTGRENLSAAFPHLKAAEVETLLKKVYANLFRLAGEILYLRRLIRASNWREFIELEGGETALDAFLEGAGGILVSGHLGNWELLSRVLPFMGLPSRALARPLDNPLLERYILDLRESGAGRVIVKRGSGALVESILEKGGFVSMLVDQDAGRKGAFVPFLGRLASTWRSPALLSMRTGAPIIPGCCVRGGDGTRFKVFVGRAIYPRTAADVGGETLRITREFTRQIEGWVREYPEQYLWLHRRWKTAPDSRSLVWPIDGKVDAEGSGLPESEEVLDPRP